MPSQSVLTDWRAFRWAKLLSLGFAARMPLALVNCVDPEPKNVAKSFGTLSNSMLATEKAPTSQPARVNGTHGAGAFLPSSVSMFGRPSPFAAEAFDSEVQ